MLACLPWDEGLARLQGSIVFRPHPWMPIAAHTIQPQAQQLVRAAGRRQPEERHRPDGRERPPVAGRAILLAQLDGRAHQFPPDRPIDIARLGGLERLLHDRGRPEHNLGVKGDGQPPRRRTVHCVRRILQVTKDAACRGERVIDVLGASGATELPFRGQRPTGPLRGVLTAGPAQQVRAERDGERLGPLLG